MSGADAACAHRAAGWNFHHVGRFLLHRWEKVAALFTSGALRVALAFLVAWLRHGAESSAWLAVGWIVARHSGEDALLHAFLFTTLMFVVFPARRWMLALPSVTAGGRSRSGR